ncbi:M10 family metallopeptidase [Microvirga sp. P5_D2]
MAAAGETVRANNPSIDGVLSGLQWNGSEVTYSFPAQAAFYGTGYGSGEPQNNFEPLTNFQISVARSIFRMISATTNLTLTEVEETASTHADIRLAMSGGAETGWTYTLDEAGAGGDSWFNSSSGRYDAPVIGNFAFWTFLHEIAHTLGLKHAHEDAVFGRVPVDVDSMEFSVTTYRSFVGAAGARVENEPWGYAQSLMMGDIAALQQMYGANFSARAGPTTYRWDHKTGQAFIDGVGQGLPGGNRIFCTVWDGGGIDTYDFANYRADLSVDLRPGHWSTLSTGQLAYLGGFRLARGNVANALLHQGDPRSFIENATGGSGDDRIVGNSAGNHLKGRQGKDRLFGLEGADTLNGGQGHDVLSGGEGRDVFVFNTTLSAHRNRDTISDFNVRDDSLYLDNAVFKSLGAGSAHHPQRLKKAFYSIGEEARDRNDFIVYHKQDKVLLYDPDGSGPKQAVPIVTFSKELKITSHDIFVV